MSYRKKSHFVYKPWQWLLALILVAALVYLGATLINNNGSGNKSTAGTSSTAPADAKNRFASNQAASEATSKASPSSGATTLLEPTGTFVSNHRPNLSGSPAPSQEQSVCNTTPGAKCHIEFNKAAITKQLETKTADASGAVYWTWNVKDLGLTEGNWDVSAVATLDSLSKTTKDALQLEVKP